MSYSVGKGFCPVIPYVESLQLWPMSVSTKLSGVGILNVCFTSSETDPWTHSDLCCHQREFGVGKECGPYEFKVVLL